MDCLHSKKHVFQCSPSTLCEKCLKAIPTVIIEDTDDPDDEDGEQIDDDELDSTDEKSDSDEDSTIAHGSLLKCFHQMNFHLL